MVTLINLMNMLMFLNYNKNKTIFVCGDFNVNLLNHSQHYLTDNFQDILHGYGLYTLITQPTRITIHSATLLDNIFTNVPFNNAKSGVIINDISDHLPIFAVINYRGWISTENLKKYKTIRQFTDENMQALNNYLIRFDWTTITSCTDVDECYSLFINEIIDAINFQSFKKKVHLRTSHNPWMTKGIINACNKKNNLYKIFIKNRNEINEQRYKKYKNKLISVLRMSKQEYYTKILNKHKNNIKETWNILRNATGSSTANTFPNSFVINNKLISNKNDIVNDLNNWSEGCSLHVVALLDSIWIDKLHRLSLPTGKWAQLPFFWASQPLEPAEWLAGPAPVFLGQPATGTRRVAGTTHTQSGRR